jgi:hypothetical protein
MWPPRTLSHHPHRRTRSAAGRRGRAAGQGGAAGRTYLRERFSRIFMLISMGVPSKPNSSRSLRSMKRR